MTQLSLRFAARSEIGRVRRNNEDSGYASTNLLVVADGMGGHEAGELASAATVAAIVDAASASAVADEVLNSLANAVITSGEYIADVVAGNRELTGMGTTLTSLAVRGDRIAIAHVGDSRAYLYRDGELSQMTKDHTFVQSLVDAGEITKEEAAVHPRRNLMMRAIDGIHAVEVDLSVREARIGDRFMLCSDGLCGVIDDDAIIAALESSDIVNAVTQLIDSAMEHGGPDNITVVVADLTEDDFIADPVLIGAAADPSNQNRLPTVNFPEESEPETTSDYFVYAPATKRGWIAPILVALTVFAAGLGIASWWLSNQWFVGVFPQTNVVSVYQGVPVGGLNRLASVSDLDVEKLPAFERAQVLATINQPSREVAMSTIERLQVRAAACVTQPTSGCPGVTP